MTKTVLKQGFILLITNLYAFIKKHNCKGTEYRLHLPFKDFFSCFFCFSLGIDTTHASYSSGSESTGIYGTNLISVKAMCVMAQNSYRN